MTRPAPGRLSGNRGFTLLELMVVMVIIGVIIGFAALSIGDGGRSERIETEARRLAALMQLTGDEAILNGSQLGLLLTPEGYRFLTLGQEEWEPVEGDQLLRARKLPDGVAMELRVDGMPVGVEEDPKKPEPHLVFLSSGDRTPFEMELGPADSFGELDEEGTRHHLEAGPFGPITLTGPGIRPADFEDE
ncbi:type II secretion system minor pseudopilin GspH [Thiohalomonas denitrificans]|uniref:Type II secretion system protein H n=1 Tax=Thiohalomonas denitrificans TaxID=415747 RepID=A0A1G5QDA6_9GAMM|nr:type II secretion system minor pseudopilin GspH [Thiohalomonas denitrificans]SCZ59632.1 general secretion pathway protein H [Thiohalomonas denitrificans]